MCVDALTKIHPVKKHEELVSLFMTYKWITLHANPITSVAKGCVKAS
jgi:hypothetical protein